MKRLATIVLCLSISFSINALEIREGRLKLTIHENTGRFSLFFLSDIQKDRYESLFVDQDPRTSFVALLLDDRTHRLGESTTFRSRVERTDKGVKVYFESATLNIVQEFVFLRTSEVALVDAVRIDLMMTNKSDREISVGARITIDTNLGEKNTDHFKTNTRNIQSETILTPAKDGDSRWITENEKFGLMGSIQEAGMSPPDSIHFANWKRLNDAPWKANVSVGRNFNLLPYSIGDSALSYYFDPKPIPRGADRTVSIMLGVSNPSGFGMAKSESNEGLSQLLQTSVVTAGSPELALRTDLISVRDLLSRVEIALKDSGSISDEELATLETITVRLRERNPGR